MLLPEIQCWETVRAAKISWASPILAAVDGKYQVVITADPIVAGYDVETGEEIWSVECMMGEVGPSVAYSDGIVVAANEYARMVAIDIRTGETLWENDEYLPEASSPLAHDGLLVYCNQLRRCGLLRFKKQENNIGNMKLVRFILHHQLPMVKFI